MNSRQRVKKVLNHQAADRIPLDLGATGQTGISASTLAKLRNTMGLENRPIRIIEPFQQLGEVEQDVRDYLGVDVIGLWNRTNLLGITNENWKPWKMGDGTPVLMGGNFEYDVDEKGNTLVYPAGDRSAPPSLKMPPGGSFFDNITERVDNFDPDDLDARRDFKDLYGVYTGEDARHLEIEATRLFDTTEYAIISNFGGGGFGDVAVVPGPYEKYPRGIRKLEDWYVAHILYPDYIRELFAMQTEIALKNLEITKQAVGDKIEAIMISGTDFGNQNGEMMSVQQFRDIYKPYYKQLNDWVHANTPWKTYYHCCGSIVNLLDEFIEAGVDILNPVQCSAAGMDPAMLKEKYGDKLVFWGGGIDTQHLLPFGAPEEVHDQVLERCRILSARGGFIFATIHNVLAQIPVENIIATYKALQSFNLQ